MIKQSQALHERTRARLIGKLAIEKEGNTKRFYKNKYLPATANHAKGATKNDECNDGPKRRSNTDVRTRN